MVPPKLAGPSGPAPASPGAIMFGRAWAQVRLWVQMAAFAAGLAAFVSPASATLTVVSANPTTYTYAGEVITFNYTFTADTHIINSVFYSVQGNVSVSALNCTGLPLSPNATTTCTATHTVQPGEVGLPLQQYGGSFNTTTNGGPYGGSVTGSATVTYVPPPMPSVTSVTPNSGPTAGGTAITISGTNFTGATGATIGGAAVTSFSVVNSTTITGVTPARTAGAKTVTVQHPNGDDSLSSGFTYIAAGVTVSPGSLSAANIGTAYNQAITASGGTAPYTYAVTAGALPAGLTLSSGGTLSGTPTAGGSFNFTVTATDSAGSPASGSQAYALTVNPPTIMLSPLVPSGTATVPFSQTITASGGTASYSFAVTSGALPPGLTLASNGSLTGTPTATGTFNFTVTATDSSTGAGPYTGSSAYSLVIDPASVSITPATASLPAGTAAVAYSQQLSATGGTGAYTWSVSFGALPAGLTLNSSSGLISGTPTAAGNFTFNVTAVNSNGSGTRGYTLAIAAPNLQLTSSAFANGRLNTPYSQTNFTPSGGTAPYTYDLFSGALQAGLSVNPATGEIHGTPTASGTYNFTVRVTDSTTGTGAPFTAIRVTSLTVLPDVSITTAQALPNGQVQAVYNQSIAATGGDGGPYSFAVTGGALPAGLTLASDGTLSGTPTAGGPFAFTVTATDQGGFTGSKVFTLGIAPPTIDIAPATIPNAVEGTPYSQSLSASGGTGSYTFAVTSGALPGGLTLASNGTLSGTPTATGLFVFSVTATDSSGGGGPYTGTRTLVLGVIQAMPTVVSVSPTTGPGAGGTTVTITGTHFNGASAVSFGGTPAASFAVNNSTTITATAPAHATGVVNVAVTTPGGTGTGVGLYTYDGTPPTIVGLPANQTYAIDFPDTTRVVSWTAPTASDNAPGATIQQIAGPVSGSAFPLGTTTVTYRATDAVNNTTDASFTVTINQTPPGSVQFVLHPQSDGAYTFTSPEPALNFTVNTVGGSGQSAVIQIKPGTFNLAFTTPNGVGLTSATCSPSTSSVNTAAKTAQVVVTSNVAVVCTINGLPSLSEAQQAIGDLLDSRADLIVANGPDMSRRIERLNGGGGGGGSVSAFGITLASSVPFALSVGADRMSFSYSLGRSRAIDRAQHASAPGFAGVTPIGAGAQLGLGVSAAADPTAMPSGGDRFDLWVEGLLAGFNSAGGDGTFAIVHAGADYLVTPDLLLGVGIQVDWTDMDTDAGGTVSGVGVMAGPYMTARLGENLYFDARAAWGTSKNDISPFGTFEDSFDATRSLYTAALIGDFASGNMTIQPQARLTYFRERTDPYVDSLSVAIPGMTVTTGQLAIGPQFSWRMVRESGAVLTPRVKLDAVYVFKLDHAGVAATQSPDLRDTGLRGRIEAGFTYETEAGALFGLGAFYDGIGEEDFEAWGGTVEVRFGF